MIPDILIQLIVCKNGGLIFVDSICMYNSEKLIAENVKTEQFLTFIVDGAVFGADIGKVMEIKGWEATTSIPESSKYMRGVINLRGQVIPIFDLKSRFGIGYTEINSSRVVILVNLAHATIGLLVEGVSDIITVDSCDIKESPQMNTKINSEYIRGIAAFDQKMIVLLNVENLFDNTIQGNFVQSL